MIANVSSAAAAPPGWAWGVLGGSLLILLTLDLLAHRGDHSSTRNAAIGWSCVWVGAGLAFGVLVWLTMGRAAAEDYLAAYAIEKSLSLDNLFVFLMIFKSLDIPEQRQRTVLIWGILGALSFRALFVFLGIAALRRWEWLAQVFALVLAVGAYRVFRGDFTPNRKSPLVGWLSSRLPMAHRVHGNAFIVRGERIQATPLLVALVTIELSDVMFAVDSVPAALSITHNRFIVYSSNAFAILGLRALYILMVHSVSRLKYLHFGLAAVLLFAACKIALDPWLHVPALLSTGVIASLIGATVYFSLRGKPGS